jgi:glycerophosphoryl diester phosphodiesterase
MRTILLASVIAAAAGFTGCGGPSDPTATASTEAPAAKAAQPAERPAIAAASLPERLDCLRKAGGVLIIGHRGGPTRDYPENAIETFERTYRAGTHSVEVDVQTTKDGKLVLMHDDELDRTTTGSGLVSDHTLADIQALSLETYSKTTDFHPPTLEAALDWAVKNNALLDIDKKRSASYDPIIAAIRAAKAETNAMLMTYTDEQAAEVHGKAPDLTITATVNDLAHLDRLLARGVKADRLLAWTGTSAPDPVFWKGLSDRGVEAKFGTLGPRATSLDTRYWEDDDGGEYNQLVTDGLAILATDITDKAARQLSAERSRAAACGL